MVAEAVAEAVNNFLSTRKEKKQNSFVIFVRESSLKRMDKLDSLSPRNAFDGDATAESAA